MDNYREKIVRIVERELKRTEEYQQRRDEYGNEEYILGCIMVKGDAFPKEVIAHAFVEDMGLELQFQIWRDEPRIRQKQAMWYDLTLFDVEGDFFGKLEQGYLILGRDTGFCNFSSGSNCGGTHYFKKFVGTGRKRRGNSFFIYRCRMI